MKEGLKEGRQEGRSEGQARLLEIQLTQRFGALPEAIRSRLAALSPSQIEAIALRLVTADHLDGVIAELQAL